MDHKTEQLREPIQRVADSLRRVMGPLADFCCAFVELAAEVYALTEYEKQREVAAIERASPRVRHLAKYGKKARTRKKNTNRALREYQRSKNNDTRRNT